MNAAMNAARGFTLLEVLLAAAITASVALLLGEIAHRASATARSERLSDYAHSAALSGEQLLRAHASPGMAPPCPRFAQRVNALHREEDEYWLNAWGGSAVFPSDSAAATAVHELGDDTGDRIAENDVVVLRRIDSPVAVRAHDLDAQSFNLQSVGDFSIGDLAVVCDASTAVAFQITSVSPSKLSLGYRNVAAVRPGNDAAQVRALRDCGQSVCALEGAIVGRLRVAAFYIGHGHHNKDASLFRKTLTLRRSAQTGTRPYMFGGETLSGIHEMRAVVVARHGNHIVHQLNGDNAIGMLIHIVTASPERHARDASATFAHTFNLAL